jgi:Flp pilus assembly protein CpaB
MREDRGGGVIAGDQHHDYSTTTLRSGRRRPLKRVSAAHLLMVVAAVLAFAVNLLLLRSRDDTVGVVGTAREISTGEILSPADFAITEVDVSPEVLGTLIRWEEVGLVEGKVANRSMGPGALLTPLDLVDPAASGGRRSMSVPIDPAHAVGGALVPGDRIDLIHVSESGPDYVMVDAEVLAVSTADRSALSSSAPFNVVIAVDAEAALAVAAAIRDGNLEIVRATGAAPISPHPTP